MKFNDPFSVAPCPTKTDGVLKRLVTDYEAMKSLVGVCLDTTAALYTHIKPENRTTFSLENRPDLGFEFVLLVGTKNGVVSTITISLKQSNFVTLLMAFKDRYGTPTSIESETVKTKAGAVFNALNVTWKGKKVTINMYERSGKVDQSMVLISDNAIMEAEIAAQRAKVAAEAQKF